MLSNTVFAELRGKTIATITGLEVASERVEISCTDGSKFILQHDQDCCETVEVNDVIGDAADLVGSPILAAEEVSSADDPHDFVGGYDESHTWTFYKLATINGSVTIRWLGTSNGYYSERVSCYREDGAKNAG
jgi:hypothetical protein